MEFEVNINQVILRQQDQVESGEYNVTECNFTFTNEYDGLTKKAVFTGEDGTAYLQTIVDNKCSIPSEILEVSQVVEIGVYAYDVENEELVLRYSPEPTQFYIHQGSYKEAQNSTPPTPSEIEQLQAQITTNANNIQGIQGDIAGINQELVGINGELLGINRDIEDIKAEQTEQNTSIQNNTDNITALQNTKADKSEIPTKTSDLINDTDFVSDANYVHTDNNFTDEDKAQITTNASNITTLQNTKADRTEIPTKTSQLNNDSGFITKNVDDLANYYKKSETYNKTEVNTLLDGKVDKVQGKGLSSNDFTDNDKNQIEANQTAITNIKDGTTIDSFGDVETALNGKEDKSNKVTSISSSSTNTQYPSAKLLYDKLAEKQTEIDNLQTDVEDLRNASYKVPGTGTDITLNNTAKGRLLKNELGGRTEQDGEATPENPVPIKNVTGNANVKIQNKNLVNNDFTKWTNGAYAYIPIQLKQGQAYILSAERVGELKTNYYNFGIVKDGTAYPFVGFKTIIDYGTGNPLSDYTFTTDDTWTNPKLVCYIASSETKFNELFQNYKIQLEQGSTATSYVPHQEQNLPFTFAEGQRAMQGTEFLDDGIHQKRKQIVFDGSEDENWIRSNSLELFYTSDILNLAKQNGNLKCNYFIQVSPNSTLENGQVKYNSTTNCLLQFKNTDITTVTQWREWLDTHNLVVEYELEEEEIIPYNSTQQAQYNAKKQARSYDDMTIISSESDELGFNIDVESLANANNMISIINSRLDLLEG